MSPAVSECPTLPFDVSAPPERWLPVVGYEGLYVVSDLGRVRRIGMRRREDITRNPSGILKQVWRVRYLGVTLYSAGPRKSWSTHTLVTWAFLGPRPEGLEVRHLDGNPQNNALSNLRYGTTSENALDRVRHGTHSKSRETHCAQGHGYTPENTAATRGRGRSCRTCYRAANRASNGDA